MTVVINDLEVVAAPDSTGGSGAGLGPRLPEPAGQTPTPFELRALLRHTADRAERARAD
jgi:hypothetical protein